MCKKINFLALQLLTILFVAGPTLQIAAQDVADRDRGRESTFDLYDRNRERLDFNPMDYQSNTREDVYDRDYYYQGQDMYPDQYQNNNQDYYNYQR